MISHSKDNYTLRRFVPADWESYKLIRLQALQTNPEMFGSSYAKEALYSQNDWVSLLEIDTRAMFGLYHLDSLIGLSGATIKKENPFTAILFASFIKKTYRGLGLSKLFYQVRMDWARSKKCESVTVSHRLGNEISKAANQSFGFTYSHTNNVVWPYGVYDDELVYVLTL